ncbi:MAG TPA: carbamoyltransferase C-terminal domain-containing protein [Thermoanaerobaculaceae bacterium]|nr:carbamoyltransferase C-terminal domain-containing protein [Thermoanaerobaculaceae bacterium]
MTILGINAFHADAAAVILRRGSVVAGVEEERFTRIKHWAGFPQQAIRHCLSEVGAESIESIGAIGVSRQPRAYLWRKAMLALAHPRSLGRALGRVRNIAQVGSLEQRLAATFGDRGSAPRVVPVEHHLAHVASAFFCSPFEEAACLTVDGFGDFVSTMLAVGRGTHIEVLQRVHFPHSLGLFYTAVTQYLGFPKYGDEYKVMGLAAYGEPRFVPQVRSVVPSRPDGTFVLDLRYFRHLSEGVDMTWDAGEPTLGDVFTPELEKVLGRRRHPAEEIEQRHKDIAASLQAVYEERFLVLVREVLRRTGMKRLTLAGGCAMNSLANGRLLEKVDLDGIFIQAAAGDAGTALGAALYVQHAILEQARSFVMDHSYWGPEYDEGAIRRAVAAGIQAPEGRDGVYGDLVVETIGDEGRLLAETAAAIARGEVVGWYQGRSEWGPRALGNRSILADPRRADMRDILNLKIKRREAFRPFAPSILEERTGEWFTLSVPDPFMIKVYPIRPEKRPLIPAVTHADGTGRLQTVSERTSALYWRLIREFERITGVPLVLNTSFNENEPIVNTPAEAVECFLRTRMDRLVIDNVTLRRRT